MWVTLFLSWPHTGNADIASSIQNSSLMLFITNFPWLVDQGTPDGCLDGWVWSLVPGVCSNDHVKLPWHPWTVPMVSQYTDSMKSGNSVPGGQKHGWWRQTALGQVPSQLLCCVALKSSVNLSNTFQGFKDPGNFHQCLPVASAMPVWCSENREGWEDVSVGFWSSKSSLNVRQQKRQWRTMSFLHVICWFNFHKDNKRTIRTEMANQHGSSKWSANRED